MKRKKTHSLEMLCRCRKGGGAPAMPAPAAPPPAATALEVQMQRRDTMKSNAHKKGIQSTILAGENQNKGKATVLGGA